LNEATQADLGRHEILHMSFFLLKAVREELVEHDAVQANPRWKALAELAEDALIELYQDIGRAAAEALIRLDS
jgi:hypothetical protein